MVRLGSKLRKREAFGFSLLELLIAMFVFSILAGFAYRSVSIMSKTKDGLVIEEQKLMGVQRSLAIMSADFRQLSGVEVNTGGSGSDSDVSLAQLKLQAGDENTLVDYSLEGGKLLRSFVLAEGDDKSSAVYLLDSVTSANMGGIKDVNAEKEEVLTGFELELEHETLGTIRHVAYLNLKTSLEYFEEELGIGGSGAGGGEEGLFQVPEAEPSEGEGPPDASDPNSVFFQ